MYAGIVKGMVTGFKGDWNSAVNIMRPIIELAGDFNLALAFYGYACAKNGNLALANQLLQQLERKHHTPGAPPLDHLLSLMYISLGDKENFTSIMKRQAAKRLSPHYTITTHHCWQM